VTNLPVYALNKGGGVDCTEQIEKAIYKNSIVALLFGAFFRIFVRILRS